MACRRALRSSSAPDGRVKVLPNMRMHLTKPRNGYRPRTALARGFAGDARPLGRGASVWEVGRDLLRSVVGNAYGQEDLGHSRSQLCRRGGTVCRDGGLACRRVVLPVASLAGSAASDRAIACFGFRADPGGGTVWSWLETTRVVVRLVASSWSPASREAPTWSAAFSARSSAPSSARPVASAPQPAGSWLWGLPPPEWPRTGRAVTWSPA